MAMKHGILYDFIWILMDFAGIPPKFSENQWDV
jgi:hypothetical protein